MVRLQCEYSFNAQHVGSSSQGALAIVANGETIGALGVSGAPGGNFDEDCARFALDKVKDRLK